ncbi:MAG: 1-acyl-sn-glycerol-3-phosphate acyltransferase [Clostridia bacterium]|nr:1-acyl-sn-glycerol-3-phosphate acyltransferase [Clostridia bacterium]
MSCYKQSEKQTVVNKPSKLLYWLLVPLANLIAKILFGFRVHKDQSIKQIKGPFVAIGTHSCTMDVAFMMLAMMPHPLNIVCGRDVFTWKPVKPILSKAGLIPISQFEADLYSIRLMKKAVMKGCSLSLFPEGKRSIDGRNLHYLSPSLAKLIKFLDVPIVMCHNNGGYCVSPRWSKAKRRGKVLQDTKLLFTAEQIRSMSVGEIYKKLREEFSYNDNLYQKEHHLRIKCKKPALGLHYLLYKCPKCGAEYQMESTENELRCTACGNTAIVNEYGEIVAKEGGVAYSRLDIWYDFEKEAVREEIAKPDFFISKPVSWKINDPETNIYHEKGEGELYINTEEIGFRGKDHNGEVRTLRIALKGLHTIVQKVDEAIDLTIDGVINRFYFKENKFSAKYNLIVEEYFRKMHGLDE